MEKKELSPQEILLDLKKELAVSVKNRHHGFHTPVFSNLDKKFNIQNRIVVIRSFDSESFSINFHTDIRSSKIPEIERNNRTSFLFYDSKIKIQLKIRSESIIHHNNEICLSAWKRTKLASRKCYLTTKPPSSKSKLPTDAIPVKLKGIDPNEKESQAGYKNFTVIENKIEKIEWLKLSYSGHRRLLINLNNKSNIYQWLIP